MMDNDKMSAVRFAVPSGHTRAEMREWLKSSDHGKALYAHGDCLLVWANEGDLFSPGLSSPLGAVDAIQLAAIIRQVDGNHDLGAAALADAIIAALPLPTHAARLAAALKLPEVAALVTLAHSIRGRLDVDFVEDRETAEELDAALAALEARHE